MKYSRMTYLTDGVQTGYRFGFAINQADELRVFTIDPLDLESVPLYLGEDYLVSGVGEADGGEIQLTENGLKKSAAGLKLVLKPGGAYKLSAISGLFDISYEEQWTGHYDRTDGNRKIYVKTINFGELAGQVTENQAYDNKVPHRITGLRKVWHLSGVYTAPNTAGWGSITFVWPFADTRKAISLQCSKSSVMVCNGYDLRNHHAVVTMVYTKDAD